MRLLFVILLAFVSISCSSGANNAPPNANVVRPQSTPLPVYGYEVVKSYPHDPRAFTEGLFFSGGFLYESTGEEGRSSLRKIELETGKIVQKWDNPPEDFGEGTAMIGDQIYQLT